MLRAELCDFASAHNSGSPENSTNAVVLFLVFSTSETITLDEKLTSSHKH